MKYDDGTTRKYNFLEAIVDTRNDKIVSFVDKYIQKQNIVCNKPNLFYGMRMN